MAVVDLSVACHKSDNECLLRWKNREPLFLFLVFFLEILSGFDGFRNSPTMKLLFLLHFFVLLDLDHKSDLTSDTPSSFSSGIRFFTSFTYFDSDSGLASCKLPSGRYW